MCTQSFISFINFTTTVYLCYVNFGVIWSFLFLMYYFLKEFDTNMLINK